MFDQRDLRYRIRECMCKLAQDRIKDLYVNDRVWNRARSEILGPVYLRVWDQVRDTVWSQVTSITKETVTTEAKTTIVYRRGN